VDTAKDIAAWGDGEPRAPVATLATFVGAALAVNGGYFDENGRVLGLRATRAHRFSSLRQADWGVFSIVDDKPLVRHTRDAAKVVDGFAVQCGPRLVVEGEPLTFKPGAHHRTAIGYDGNDWVSLLVTIDPIELEDLAAALAKPSDQGGLGLIAALNLDGGPSTAMYVGGVHAVDWSIPSPTPVADAVAVVPRGAALPWEARGIETH
jgi:exopolysaccharide biosynthesis protein